jgi:hypothetical protein
MRERPCVRRIAQREVDVRLELAGVVYQVEHASAAAAQLQAQRLLRRNVIVRLGKSRSQSGQITGA